MSIGLYRLGRAIGRHRGMVVGIWVLVLVALGGAAATFGDRYDDSFSIPGTESQEGQDLLAERFGLTGANGQVLFEARTGKITDPANASEVASSGHSDRQGRRSLDHRPAVRDHSPP